LAWSFSPSYFGFLTVADRRGAGFQLVRVSVTKLALPERPALGIVYLAITVAKAKQ
jgi:hypothetical protein